MRCHSHRSHPVKRSSQTSNERQPLSAVVMELLYTFNRAILRWWCAQNPTWNGSYEFICLSNTITQLWTIFHIHLVLGYRCLKKYLSQFCFEFSWTSTAPKIMDKNYNKHFGNNIIYGQLFCTSPVLTFLFFRPPILRFHLSFPHYKLFDTYYAIKLTASWVAKSS